MRVQQTGRVVVVLAGILVIAADSGDAVKSGPQVGARISTPFEVRMCNGPDAGDMACLV
jgi:hypothetical protein